MFVWQAVNEGKSVSCLGIINHCVLWQAEQLASRPKLRPTVGSSQRAN